MIIALTGKKGSGRTEVTRYLVEQRGFVRLAFSDQAKEIAREVFGLTVEETDGALRDSLVADRRARSWTGRELVDQIYASGRRGDWDWAGWLTDALTAAFDSRFLNAGSSCWVEAFQLKLVELRQDRLAVVVPDVQHPNEGRMLEEWGASFWHVDRDGPGSEPVAGANESDYRIGNDGTIEQLQARCAMILETLAPSPNSRIWAAHGLVPRVHRELDREMAVMMDALRVIDLAHAHTVFQEAYRQLVDLPRRSEAFQNETRWVPPEKL